MRTIFHLDLDAFFVSVERILDPSLEGKPVIVGGDPHGRGVVAACSYEARKYGLHSAMPIRTAYKLCPQGIYLHGHFSEYVRYSKLVREILTGLAPQIEQASIDEFYMDFTGTTKIYGSMLNFASTLQQTIHTQTQLPASIGIGTNKTIAKIASDRLKPRGITYVQPGCEKEFLSPLPVQIIPGVGKVTLQNLNERGIYTCGDITRLPLEYFTAAHGKWGEDLWHKAAGEGNPYLTPPQDRKSISKEHTYGENVLDREVLKKTIFELTGEICQILRNNGWMASTINIKLRYSDFNTLTRAKTIKPTDDDREVFNTAWALIEKAYTRRLPIRLIGVGLTKFTPFAEQEFLFEDEEVKRKKLLKAVNSLRTKYGFNIIDLGKLSGDE